MGIIKNIRLRAVENLCRNGSTSGERAAARAAYYRLTGQRWVDPDAPMTVLSTEVREPISDARWQHEAHEFQDCGDDGATSYPDSNITGYGGSAADYWQSVECDAMSMDN